MRSSKSTMRPHLAPGTLTPAKTFKTFGIQKLRLQTIASAVNFMEVRITFFLGPLSQSRTASDAYES